MAITPLSAGVQVKEVTWILDPVTGEIIGHQLYGGNQGAVVGSLTVPVYLYTQGTGLNNGAGTNIVGILYGNGTTIQPAPPSAFPTLNQNTSGNAATASTASNVAGGSPGTVLYQSANGSTAFTSVGQAGQILTSGGQGVPVWGTVGGITSVAVATANGFGGTVATPTTTPTISITTTVNGILYGNGATAVAAVAGNFPTLNQNTTGSAASATSATTATNLASGALGSIPYQSGAGATAMLAPGTAGQVLSCNGSAAPSWSSAVGTVTNTLGALVGGQVVVGNGGSDLYTIGWSVAGTTGQTYTFPNASDTVVCLAATQTLTNKRITARVGSTSANSATITINTDLYDVYKVLAQSVNITAINVTGTPVDNDELILEITSTPGAVTIAGWNGFENGNSTLPTTTGGASMIAIGFLWNTATNAWRCMSGGPITVTLSSLSLAGLPTTLPGSSGVIWNNGGVLSVS